MPDDSTSAKAQGTMKVGRRSLLLGAAAVIGGGGVYAKSKHWRADSFASQPLQIPPLLDARSGQSISLTARAGQTQFFAGRASPTQGYNVSYLRPTLRLHRGDNVQMAVWRFGTNAVKKPIAASQRAGTRNPLAIRGQQRHEPAQPVSIGSVLASRPS